MLCASWECSTCGPYLKEVWFDHLLLCVTGLLNVVRCSPGEWETVRKAIQRDLHGHTDFVRFDLAGSDTPLGEATNVIITTSSIGMPIGHADALRLVSNLVQAVPFDQSRISTSEAWEKAKTHPSKAGQWQRVAPIFGSLEKSRQAAKALGLGPNNVSPLKGKTGPPWAEAYEVHIPSDKLDSPWWRYTSIPMLCQPDDGEPTDVTGVA